MSTKAFKSFNYNAFKSKPISNCINTTSLIHISCLHIYKTFEDTYIHSFIYKWIDEYMLLVHTLILACTQICMCARMHTHIHVPTHTYICTGMFSNNVHHQLMAHALDTGAIEVTNYTCKKWWTICMISYVENGSICKRSRQLWFMICTVVSVDRQVINMLVTCDQYF